MNDYLHFCSDVTVFVLPMLSVSEGDGIVLVCATLFAVEFTERDFTITLTTRDDTGIIKAGYFIKCFAALGHKDCTIVHLIKCTYGLR